MSHWYYTRDSKTSRGPVTSAELKSLAMSGQVVPTDLVWKQGASKWVAARKVKGLFPKGPSVSVPKAAGSRLLTMSMCVVAIGILSLIATGVAAIFSQTAAVTPAAQTVQVGTASVEPPPTTISKTPILVEGNGDKKAIRVALSPVVDTAAQNIESTTIAKKSIIEPVLTPNGNNNVEPVIVTKKQPSNLIDQYRGIKGKQLSFVNGPTENCSKLYQFVPDFGANMPFGFEIPDGTFLKSESGDLIVKKGCQTGACVRCFLDVVPVNANCQLRHGMKFIIQPPVEPVNNISQNIESTHIPTLIELMRDKKVHVVQKNLNWHQVPNIVLNFVVEPIDDTTIEFIVPCGTYVQSMDVKHQNLICINTCKYRAAKGKGCCVDCSLLNENTYCLNGGRADPRSGVYRLVPIEPGDPRHVLVEQARKMEGKNYRGNQEKMWQISERLKIDGNLADRNVRGTNVSVWNFKNETKSIQEVEQRGW